VERNDLRLRFRLLSSLTSFQTKFLTSKINQTNDPSRRDVSSYCCCCVLQAVVAAAEASIGVDAVAVAAAESRSRIRIRIRSSLLLPLFFPRTLLWRLLLPLPMVWTLPVPLVVSFMATATAFHHG
jgi:hypothetical protein